MTEKLRLSYSKASTFLHCRQEYVWIYEEMLSPKRKAFPLQIGDIVHQLFHLQYEGKLTPNIVGNMEQFVREVYPDNTDQETFQVAYEALNLFSGYLAFWSNDPITVTSSEVHLEYEMPDFILYGRIDALGRMGNSKLWKIERKTTKTEDSALLNGFRKGLQGGVYDFLLTHCLEERVQGTIYDLLIKTKVPKYKRNPVMLNRKRMDRAIKCMEGVARDIKRGDFYPTCDCFTYNRECDYAPLCNFDSPEVRQNFFVRNERG